MKEKAFQTLPGERALPICIALLAVLGTFLLGVARGDYVLTFVVFISATLSLYITDFKHFFLLSQRLANVAAIIAVGFTMLEFFRVESEEQLLAISRLLVYLQVVLLFQKKTIRLHWHIALLSLLQVVVAAALGISPFFGTVLAVYGVLAILTLIVFHLHTESRRYLDRSHASWQQQEKTKLFSIALPVSHYTNSSTSPLGRFHQDGSGEPLSRDIKGIVKSLFMAVFVTSVVSLIIFTFMPRVGSKPWRSSALRGARMTGYSSVVTLGSFGEIHQNTEEVFQVKFVDSKTGFAFLPEVDPYMRGSILTRYVRGRWSHHRGYVPGDQERLPTLPDGKRHVRQEMTLQPMDESVVFSVYPAVEIEKGPVAYDADLQQYSRYPRALSESQITFSLGTTGFSGTRQISLNPEKSSLITSGSLFTLLSLPPTVRGKVSLPNTRRIAKQVLEEANIKPMDDPVAACKELEKYLRDSGKFAYTLNSTRVDQTLDPVEDFILNMHEGHCEYFASALVLMLRSQGIPARIVIGYQGGDWNPVGEFYQFQQLHAHSWVEAFLPRRKIRKHVKKLSDYTYGGWLRLDPTTGNFASGAETKRTFFSGIKDIGQYAARVWTRYIVGMNSQRQQEAIYEPIVNGIKSMMDPATFFQHIYRSITSVFKAIQNWLGGRWVSWRGGLIASAACTVLLILFYIGRFILRLIKRLFGKSDTSDEYAFSMVPFYRELELILHKHGMERKQGQTQQEFASEVSQTIQHNHSLSGNTASNESAVRALPAKVAKAFYRVQFGKIVLSDSEKQLLQTDLASLDQFLCENSKQA